MIRDLRENRNGLVGHWLPAWETPALIDASGRGYTATDPGGANSPAIASSSRGPVRSFDGGDFLEISKKDYYLTLAHGTFSVWFRTTSTAIMSFFGTLHTTSTTAYFALSANMNPTTGVNETGKSQLFVRANTNNNFNAGVNADMGFTDGDWHHMAVSWDKAASTMTWLMDGKPWATTYGLTATGTSFVASDRTLYLGGGNFGSLSRPFDGDLSDMRLYSVEHTRNAMANLYQRTKSPPSPRRRVYSLPAAPPAGNRRRRLLIGSG